MRLAGYPEIRRRVKLSQQMPSNLKSREPESIANPALPGRTAATCPVNCLPTAALLASMNKI